MAVLYTNNANSTLLSAITNVQTTLTVQSGKGALFPSPASPDYFYATLQDASGNIEIVKCTSRSTDTLTIIRAQDGTVGLAFAAGSACELRINKLMLDDFKTDTRAGVSNTTGVTTTSVSTNATFFLGFMAVNGAASQTVYNAASLTFNPSTGALGATSHTSTSDERLKTNWRNVQHQFVERLARVTCGVYDRTDTDISQAGVSAQALREVLPEAVLEDSEGWLSVAYGNAALVAAIKLSQRVLALEARVASLLDTWGDKP